MRRRPVAWLWLILCLLYSAAPLVSQEELSEITANDEFRWGVMSLNRGHVNEAIASLTRSLSFSPDRPLARYWLGRAYYYGGFEDAALQEWEWVTEHSASTAILNRWIERVTLSRGLTGERLGDEVAPGPYVTMTDLPGIEDDLTLFRRPTCIRARDDGFFYVVSFGTHRVALFDPNGRREREYDGNLEGFDRPFDVLPLPDGGLLVTEFGADRVAVLNVDGFKVRTFGETGVGDGQMLGPQFMAADQSGYVYISDYGNARVVKFTLSGEYVFSFGGRDGSYPGLLEPAGIVAENGRIYVADRRRSQIAVFDESGNYLGVLSAPIMENPEGLSLFSEGRILVSDENRIYAIDVNTEEVYDLNELNEDVQLIEAVIDANGNLLATDHAGDRVLFMAASEELYTGLNVELDRVMSSDHPTVYLTATVTDRSGRPLLGLSAANFRITEDRVSVGPTTIEYRGGSDESAALAVIADRSADMRTDSDLVGEAALEIAEAAQPGDQLWLIGSATDPTIESTPADGPLLFSESARGDDQLYGPSSLDVAIRLAGSQVLQEIGRRSIVIITNGVQSPQDFTSYGLTETARYLANNHISLSVVYTRPNTVNEELEYLARASDGESGYLYRVEGLAELLDRIRSHPTGRYLLRYQSVHSTDFGRAYIPVEIEVYLLDRSGRDEAGFFGPLEF
jgi:DNA-binding beta-propeller fold protein YncE